MDEEEEQEESEAPPREPLKIREYSDTQQERKCTVCGHEKEPYIQIEYGDKIEYTCEDCYKKGVQKPVSKCTECGQPMSDDDRFCGRCGTQRIANCTKCGSKATPGDLFCGKCGAKL